MAKPPPGGSPPRAGGASKTPAPDAVQTGSEQPSPTAADPTPAQKVGVGTSTSLNDQSVDAAATVDLLTVGFAPAESFALLDATLAQTLGLAMQNAVLRQQADRVISQAVISAGSARILEHAGLLLAAPTSSTPPPSAPSPSVKATS